MILFLVSRCWDIDSSYLFKNHSDMKIIIPDFNVTHGVLSYTSKVWLYFYIANQYFIELQLFLLLNSSILDIWKYYQLV